MNDKIVRFGLVKTLFLNYDLNFYIVRNNSGELIKS